MWYLCLYHHQLLQLHQLFHQLFHQHQLHQLHQHQLHQQIFAADHIGLAVDGIVFAADHIGSAVDGII